MRTRLLLGALAACAGAALGVGPVPAAADAPAGGCAWFARLDTGGANALALDQSVTYWVTRIPYVPGESLTLRGQYPHARYFSVTAYDPRTRGLSSLHDTQIQPEAGSLNPFLPGAPRNDPRRAWTVQVRFLQPGQQPSAAANTLSTGFLPGGTAPASDFFLVYRVYLPDSGRDQGGGVPLPAVSVNTPLTGEAALPGCPAGYTPPAAVNQELASAAAPTAPSAGTVPQPAWHRFYNAPTSAAQSPDSTGATSFAGAVTPYTMKTGEGGYLEDLENAYLYAFVSQGGGPLVVISAQAFTYPATQTGAPTMSGPTDVRYWSVCSYEPATQREVGCSADYQAAPGGGAYTIVVSTPANKPADLCGGAWIPFGPNLQSLLIFRNQLGSSPYAVQNVKLGQETAMGAYYPAARYMSGDAYAQAFCGAGAAAGGPGSGTDYAAAGDYGASYSDGITAGPGGLAGLGDLGAAGDGGAPADTADAAPADSRDLGAVKAAHATRVPAGNLPLGLALGALVLGGLGVFVRAKLVETA